MIVKNTVRTRSDDGGGKEEKGSTERSKVARLPVRISELSDSSDLIVCSFPFIVRRLLEKSDKF